MAAVMMRREQRWECPLCTTTALTHETRPHTEFHHCRGLAGLWSPMIPAGQRCKIEAFEREDYVGREIVTLDGNGRPVMNVRVTRDDGYDTAVYAPCAMLEAEG